jgi:hypothetical protein
LPQSSLIITAGWRSVYIMFLASRNGFNVN